MLHCLRSSRCTALTSSVTQRWTLCENSESDECSTYLLIEQLETKASSRKGQCIPAGSNVSLVENVEKTASKSMHWRRYRSSNWYEIEQKMRFQIWRSVVAPCDARDKNRNIVAQLQSILYTTAEKRFWKIYFLLDFWCAQTCSFRAVFGLPIRTFTLAVSGT